jgi:IS5 family transposase
VVVPWRDLEALIEPYYPKAGNGRQPVGLSIMLRVYFLQQWFNLSDPGAEDALYESPVLRRFAGVDLGPRRRARRDHDSSLPPPAGEHELCGQILDTVNHYLESRGLRIATGTIVDATIIAAPSRPRTARRSAIPRCIRRARATSGFSAPRRISAWIEEGMVHSVCTSAASVSDVHMLPDLLHGAEKKVWGDAGYQGQTEAIHAAAPAAQDMTSRRAKHKAASMRWSGARTAPRPECARRWSGPSAF